jgi:long-chain acyl-CoA synthetase
VNPGSASWRDVARDTLVATGDRPGEVEFDIPRESLWERFETVVGTMPRGIAVIDGNSSMTYEELREQSLRIARRLSHDHGVRAGDRVGLLMRNSTGFCLSALACWALGAIAVTLSTRLKPRELQIRIADSTPRTVIAADDVATTPAAPGPGFSVVAETDIDRWARSGPLRDAAVSGYEDTSFVLYTSGTTGQPKGVRISHRNALQAARTFEVCLGLVPDDRSIIAVPIFHGTGLFAQLVPMLTLGGTVILLGRFDAQGMVELAASTGATHSMSVPTIYQRMLSAQESHAERIPFRVIGVGGAPMPPRLYRALREAYPGARVYNSYGLTEATSPAVIMPWEHADHRLGSIGLPTPTMESTVTDPASDEPVDVGVTGELRLRGALISPGRWGSDEPVTDSEGWLRTGDLAVQDHEGFVTIVDRLKDVVNVGGEKVSSVEVENLLAEHEAVDRVAVVARPDAHLGEVPVAFVVPARSAHVDTVELTNWLAERLASYKVPRAIEVVDDLPLNAAGKVQKAELRRRVDADISAQT